MGDDEIDYWDETELIHVAACALALGGDFFHGLTPGPVTTDFVSSKAIEVAKLIIAKAQRLSAEQAGAQPDGEMYTLAALRNSGVDVECGACMEVSFTGVTTNTHTCERFRGRRDSIAFTTASEAHSAGVPVLGASGSFGGFCEKTPVSNCDSSLVVACGLHNGHDGRCNFTRQIVPQ